MTNVFKFKLKSNESTDLSLLFPYFVVMDRTSVYDYKSLFDLFHFDLRDRLGNANWNKEEKHWRKFNVNQLTFFRNVEYRQLYEQIIKQDIEKIKQNIQVKIQVLNDIIDNLAKQYKHIDNINERQLFKQYIAFFLDLKDTLQGLSEGSNRSIQVNITKLKEYNILTLYTDFYADIDHQLLNAEYIIADYYPTTLKNKDKLAFKIRHIFTPYIYRSETRHVKNKDKWCNIQINDWIKFNDTIYTDELLYKVYNQFNLQTIGITKEYLIERWNNFKNREKLIDKSKKYEYYMQYICNKILFKELVRDKSINLDQIKQITYLIKDKIIRFNTLKQYREYIKEDS